MLISIVARLESSKMSGSTLSAVQSRAWEDITAMASDVMAEQLLLLNTDRNRDFELGCQNAAVFSAILFGSETLREGVGLAGLEGWPDQLEDEATRSFSRREDVTTAWSQFFEAHLAATAQPDASAM